MHPSLFVKYLILLVALTAAGASQSQVYRCTDAKGRTTYTDEPCAGSKVLDPALLRGNTTQSLLPPPAANASNQPAAIRSAPPAPQEQRQQAAGACPSGQDVRNIETASTSIRFRDQWEEPQFLREEIQRARACSPAMTYSLQDLKDLDSYRQYQHRLDPRDRAEARRAARAIHVRATQPAAIK